MSRIFLAATFAIAVLFVGALVALPTQSPASASSAPMPAPLSLQSSTQGDGQEADVCCQYFYEDKYAWMPRKECVKIGDVVPDAGKCGPNDAVAEMQYSPGVEGSRTIGDLPALSPDSPVQGFSCTGSDCMCWPDEKNNDFATCEGMLKACKALGSDTITCPKGEDYCQCKF